jgi:hypothetical protein
LLSTINIINTCLIHKKTRAAPLVEGLFGARRCLLKRVATFEHNVKKLGGAQGFVDLFWPGKLLVEQKSLGKWVFWDTVTGDSGGS